MTVTPLPAASEAPLRLPAAERRRQLLDVATESFARRGFDACSMDDIAEAAGVTKPVLYQHFSSKSALYLELLERIGQQLLDTVMAATASASGPRRQVEAGFGAYFRFIADHEDSFLLLFKNGVHHHASFAAVLRRVEETMAAAIAPLIEADIDADHRRQLAHAVLGMAEGVGRDWVVRRSEAATGGEAAPDDQPDRLAHRVAELAWAGLRSVHRI